MHRMSRAARIGLGWALVFGAAACGSSGDSADDTTTTAASDGATTTTVAKTSAPTKFVAEVWADNWFELWVNGRKVGEDSVPITTVRSFNSERITFTATYPLTIGIMAKDYVEDESGLEYIGTPQQQIGDGGVIAQIRDETTGKVVAATSDEWTEWTIARAPMEAACEKSANPAVDCEGKSANAPVGWAEPTFDDGMWNPAVTHTAEEVGAKQGYLDITWDPTAQLVWSADLKLDNTVLLRSAPIPQP